MSAPVPSIRIFRTALLLWVLGFTLSGLPHAERLWVHPVSPAWLPPGPLKHITHAFSTWFPEMLILPAALLLVALCLFGLLRGPRWWIFPLVWFLYANLMNRAWLAGSGGQQLMANLLFWNIFLALPAKAVGPLRTWLHASAFWIVRLQLLLAYTATGLHKLTGTHWVDGTAMGIVATDPAFGPAWVAGLPMLAKMATWAVLVFQLTFPIAVWFRRTRVPWLLAGIVFHLGTAIWLDIPEMGLAFIAAYTIWLSEEEAEGLVRALCRLRWWGRGARPSTGAGS